MKVSTIYVALFMRLDLCSGSADHLRGKDDMSTSVTTSDAGRKLFRFDNGEIEDKVSNRCPATGDVATYCDEFWGGPVLCQPNNCVYRSQCHAEFAGFPLDNCREACPTLPEEAFCFDLWDPVECQPWNCPYANTCYAELAGFNVAEDCNKITPNACPVTGDAGSCADSWAPVLCQPGNCQYDNQCHAKLAGFVDPEADCMAYCPENDDEQGDCDDFWGGPVLCQPNDCAYRSQCHAEFAGFPLANCTEACPTLPEEAVCIRLWDPVECQPGNCPYANTCYAELAGFNVTEDCTKITP